MEAMNSSPPTAASSTPAQQLSIIEVFLPGSSRMLGAVNQALSSDLNIFAYLVCAFGVLGFLQQYVTRFFNKLKPYFTSTIYIYAGTEPHDMLLNWFKKHGRANESASACVVTAKTQSKASDIIRKKNKILVYRPWECSFTFRYGSTLISYKTEMVSHDTRRKDEQVMLTCLGWSNRGIKQLLEECRKEYVQQTRGKTAIYESRKEDWKRLKEKNIRPMSTVVLKESDKKPLLDDMRSFLGQTTRLWYTQRSLPYRRGYLLYGPPGTGKSSLSLSLAGQFGLDIYVISIPDATNLSLKVLFENLPERCIVLLEDIDAVGMSRQAPPIEDKLDESGVQRGAVTLSGLLNILDGVTSLDGRIVIMTTNHREKLDEALIRPGRIDAQIEFKLADRDVIADLFMFIFGPLRKDIDDEDEDTDQNLDKSKAKEKSQVRAQTIEELKLKAAEFAEKVPALTFSQAEIISFLMLHKDKPDSALEACSSWVEQSLEGKAEKMTMVNGGSKWA